MSDILNLSLFQTDIIWQSPEANLENLNRWLEQLPPSTDMVILPEMFLTGFSMDVQAIAQSMDGLGVKWIQSSAVSKNTAIAGSLTISENDRFYNRMLAGLPDGSLFTYNKRHLFRMGEEHKFFSTGNELIILNYRDWHIMPLVCYDLRFPVWSRNVDLKYDLLIYVTNWPQARRDAYLTLLKARAIENQCYVVGVNRVGTDGNGVKYSGESVVIDFKGRYMTELSSIEGIINCSISLNELREFRKAFPAYLDADTFEIK